MRLVIAFVSGALFGVGLIISGMTNTQKVQGFLDIFGAWDPTLAFVMGGALVPMAVAWRMTTRGAPIFGGSFPDAPKPRIDRGLLGGAAMFGAGWGLAGLCPGPALASLSFGGMSGIVFMAAMLGGMWCAVPVRRRLDRHATVS